MADLFTILKELKNIMPDPDYSKKSRFLMLSQIKINPVRFMNPIVRMALALGVLIFLIIPAGVYYANKANKDGLMVRANEINGSIQVKLNEIKYLLEDDNRQLSAEEIFQVQILLDETTNKLNDALSLSQNSGDLEELLKKIKSAQKILLHIDTTIK